MASELNWRHVATGDTLYATIRSAGRLMWNTAGTPALEALTVANWANYAIPVTETPASSYFYEGDWPTGLVTTHAWYWVDVYKRAGGSPAIGDTMQGTLVGYWDGVSFLPWAPTVEQIADQIWDESTVGHNVSNSFGWQLLLGAGYAATVMGKLYGITQVGAWLRAMIRKDVADPVATGEINSGGGTYDETTDSLQAQADTAVTLSSAERNAIADAHLDRAAGVETGMTPRQLQRVVLAALAGKLNRRTGVFYRKDGVTPAFTVTTDATGRTVVTFDAGL